MYPKISLFGLEYSTYGICSAIGVLLMGLVAFLLIRKTKICVEDFLIGTLVALVGAFLGAHILYGITNIPYMADGVQTFINEQKDIMFLFGVIINGIGGMVFYGGLLGALGAGALYCKIRKISIGDFSDCYAVGIPLFHVFGRIGCFLAGCCYGIESEFGFTATDALVESCNHVNRFPVQLLESGLNLILFAVMLILFSKKIMKNRLIFVYMFLYSIIRFVDEFFRGDIYRGIWLGLSTSQWISIILFIVSSVVIVKHIFDSKKENKLT
ncbi:MAG: prolipoprotein diacylglyceryl transferase [Ruminococcus sp.]